MNPRRIVACAVIVLSLSSSVYLSRRSTVPGTITQYRLLAENAPPTSVPTPTPTIAPTPVPEPSTAAKRSLRPSASKPAVPGPVHVAEGSVQAQIARLWPFNDSWVLRIAKRESGHNPRAFNKTGCRWTDKSGGVHRGCLGLMQISTQHEPRWTRMGYTREQMFELGPNLDVAAALFRESGCQPWGCV